VSMSDGLKRSTWSPAYRRETMAPGATPTAHMQIITGRKRPGHPAVIQCSRDIAVLLHFVLLHSLFCILHSLLPSTRSHVARQGIMLSHPDADAPRLAERTCPSRYAASGRSHESIESTRNRNGPSPDVRLDFSSSAFGCPLSAFLGSLPPTCQCAICPVAWQIVNRFPSGGDGESRAAQLLKLGKMEGGWDRPKGAPRLHSTGGYAPKTPLRPQPPFTYIEILSRPDGRIDVCLKQRERCVNRR